MPLTIIFYKQNCVHNMSDPVKINIGCGTRKWKGFLNIDIQEAVHPDVVMDIRYLEKIADNSVDEILAEHVLEHFPVWQTQTILNIWASKLHMGGYMKIWIPDFEVLCRYVVDGNYGKMAMQSIYGKQDHPWNYHCVGFTKEYIKELMKNAGMTVTVCESKMVDIYPNLYCKGIKNGHVSV